MSSKMTMMRRINRTFLAMVLLAACSGSANPGPATDAPTSEAPTATPETTKPAPGAPPTSEQPQEFVDVTEVDVDVFRGVDAAQNGNATLSPSQFNYNPDLSTFADPAQAPVAKPCNFKFTVTGVAHDPPQAGDTGTVAGLGYVATFDNNPPGHWSIAAGGGQGSAGATSVYAKANRGNVVNGSQDNCR